MAPLKPDAAAAPPWVANTGNDTVVQIPVNDPSHPTVLANSINGADGLIVDDDDNIWVAANQADEIVVMNPSGRGIAKLGDFGGIDSKGAPIGLLFPASFVFSKVTSTSPTCGPQSGGRRQRRRLRVGGAGDAPHDREDPREHSARPRAPGRLVVTTRGRGRHDGALARALQADQAL